MEIQTVTKMNQKMVKMKVMILVRKMVIKTGYLRVKMKEL